MVTIEINGKKVQADAGAMVIEAADAAGIHIPRFCYHKKLSIAANCRMCLVDVQKAPKPLPACATPITDGMVINTRSEKALQAQKSVMEFLLINHPLDCPICDQGGECELQDVAMGYGSDISRFTEKKRAVKDKDIGPLIATDMTRCIHCTRCVRFGEEISGLKELGAVGRGEHMEITAYMEEQVGSELSGNAIDICPVGALTSKPFRYKARTWDLRQNFSIAPHDCTGSNIYVHTANGKVMRVVPAENEAINEVWIADRERFSYDAIYHKDRIEKPLMRVNGELTEVSYLEAFKYAASKIKTTIHDMSAKQIAALASPNSTYEELYLLQKILRALGSNNIDHRLKQTDFSAQEGSPLFPKYSASMSDLNHSDAVLLIGSNVRLEQPIIAHRIRQAVSHGGEVYTINPINFDFNFAVTEAVLSDKGDILIDVAGVLKAVIAEQGLTVDFAELLENITVTEQHQKIANNLINKRNKSVLLGELSISHPSFSQIRFFAAKLVEFTRAEFGILTEGANTAGAWIGGALPYRVAGGLDISNPGLNTVEQLEQDLAVRIWLNIEPEYDFLCQEQALKALANTSFNLFITPYMTDAIKNHADLILPATTYAETDGTFVNFEGRWQSFNQSVHPFAESRPAWKILRVLGNMLGLSGFEYEQASEIIAELRKQVHGRNFGATSTGSWAKPESLNTMRDSLTRIAPRNIYAVDSLTRRASALQATKLAENNHIEINSKLAEKLGFTGNEKVKAVQSNGEIVMQLKINDNIADNLVYLPQKDLDTIALGTPYGAIELRRG